MTATSWLLLLFSLPTNRNTERVAVWRRLKKMGAVQIKTSTYLLPDEPAQYEQFQWLAQQIRDYGGDSTLVRAQEIEGLTSEKAVAMFNLGDTEANVTKELSDFGKDLGGREWSVRNVWGGGVAVRGHEFVERIAPHGCVLLLMQ